MPIEITEGLMRIFIGLAALLVGWTIGFFDSKLRADRKIRQVEEKAARAIRQARLEAERLVLAHRAETPAMPPKTGKTLLRLWLDDRQQLRLDLDDQPVEVNPLDESHRKRLLDLLNSMRPWLERRPAPPSPPRPAPALQADPGASGRVSPPRPAPTPPSPPLAKPAEDQPADQPGIVEQIDRILQARLAASPLANRSVRLQPSPDGGVIVWVGLQKFASVEEVSDPEIRAILQAAIKEWEQSQGY